MIVVVTLNDTIDEATEKTARAAADELIRNVKAGGCVDEHLQDQVREIVL